MKFTVGNLTPHGGGPPPVGTVSFIGASTNSAAAPYSSVLPGAHAIGDFAIIWFPVKGAAGNISVAGGAGAGTWTYGTTGGGPITGWAAKFLDAADIGATFTITGASLSDGYGMAVYRGATVFSLRSAHEVTNTATNTTAGISKTFAGASLLSLGGGQVTVACVGNQPAGWVKEVFLDAHVAAGVFVALADNLNGGYVDLTAMTWTSYGQNGGFLSTRVLTFELY